MKTAVRYYSRSGNTKALAEAIARAAGTKAVSVDAEDAALTEPVDVLFIGGALYAYGLDKHLKTYLQSLDAGKVSKAVVFSTAWLSKHALDLIRKELEAKGIPVASETFFAKNMPDPDVLEQAETFARKQL
ncbi:flavodoxin family protein [Catenisphaera adipataccumulans]|uniref:Flavodoxin n=1 Tax=Catenisphaera adipataccumulans TaxID=700500 RepID=A0A7W8D1F6_9FIRM|nr:flavodoxin family protein [Catenisphaera adipataccumulans]MBB5183800.1 flavodoxin [Catenisphaera adipataccumulans]